MAQPCSPRLAAFLIFDWFFVEPHHQFTVSDPEEWVSLLFFLLTATVTGQLAAGQRQRAREAQQREREAVVLYDVVRLLGEGDVDTALAAVAERLRRELHLAALAMELWRPTANRRRFDAGDADPRCASRTGGAGAARVLQRGPGASDRPARRARPVGTHRSAHAADRRA